jgi:hypothetical protein
MDEIQQPSSTGGKSQPSGPSGPSEVAIPGQIVETPKPHAFIPRHGTNICWMCGLHDESGAHNIGEDAAMT